MPQTHSHTLQELARDWYDAWNAHDLDRVLSHYAPDFAFSSPYIAAVGVDPSGTLQGHDAVRAYWAAALERFPDLHFEPISEVYGVDSVALHYRGVRGVLVIEVLELGDDGLVHRAAAHYDRLP
jgi:ketosteroid isomerase-like protein